MALHPRHAPRYRARGTRPYSSLQRALAAGIAPQALFQRRDEPPDGWQPYLIPDDPDRLRGAVSGEIATTESGVTAVTDKRVATQLSHMADRDDRAEVDTPQPRLRIGR